VLLSVRTSVNFSCSIYGFQRFFAEFSLNHLLVARLFIRLDVAASLVLYFTEQRKVCVSFLSLSFLHGLTQIRRKPDEKPTHRI